MTVGEPQPGSGGAMGGGGGGIGANISTAGPGRGGGGGGGGGAEEADGPFGTEKDKRQRINTRRLQFDQLNILTVLLSTYWMALGKWF